MLDLLGHTQSDRTTPSPQRSCCVSSDVVPEVRQYYLGVRYDYKNEHSRSHLRPTD